MGVNVYGGTWRDALHAARLRLDSTYRTEQLLIEVMNRRWIDARTPTRRDPLAIDLDRDGIETLGIPASGSPVLFDHNGDGVRTGTGWLRPDDAWLVRDLDGNGTIDAGRELFGVDTAITVTEFVGGTMVSGTRNARTGFEALRALDDNRDNSFTSTDAAWNQVQLWRDLNGDGISQAGELSTLASQGIIGIGLNETTSTTDLGNGNQVTGTAVVRRASGPDATVSGVDLTASNLDLADNPFYREFSDVIPHSDAARLLPEMGGSGLLRDLREAMSLGTSQAARLTQAVQAFASKATRGEQMAAMDELLVSWAATDPQTTVWIRGAYKTHLIHDSAGFAMQFGGILDSVAGPGWRSDLDGASFSPLTGLNDKARRLVDRLVEHGVARGTGDFGFQGGYSSSQVISPDGTYRVRGPTYWSLDRMPQLLRQIGVLQAFNAQNFLSSLWTFDVWAGAGGDMSYTFLAEVPQPAADLMRSAYDALTASVYEALAMQTRLRPYLDGVTLVVEPAGIRFDSTGLAALLASTHTASPQKAIEDLSELIQFAMPTLQGVGFDAVAQLRTWIDALPSDSSLRSLLPSLMVSTGPSMAGTDSDQIWLGGAANESVNAGGGADVLDGATGNDTLNGGAGDDWLMGREGDDTLFGDSGDDSLDGGFGNDALHGGLGNNTYRFGRGDGFDRIDGRWNETTAGKLNTLEFKTGVAPSNIVLRQVHDGYWSSNWGLEVSIAGTTDRVLIESFFAYDNPANSFNPVQRFTFSNGEVLDTAAIMSRVVQGALSAPLAGDINQATTSSASHQLLAAT